MAEKSRMHLALQRFETALRNFETAVSQVKAAEQRRNALESENRKLLEDRSRLAEELDSARSKAMRLDNVNTQVSARIGAAMDNIRTILGSA